MEKMSDREILSAVRSEFESSMGAPGGEISIERAKAWDYYLSKKLGNEVDGQSQVVTSDVSDIVDGIMPSLLRAFTTKENLVSFDPVGPEDVAQAQQESDYVNHEFFKLSGEADGEGSAFLIMYTWMFDSLVQKNGYVKAWWDESEKVTTEEYSNLTEIDLIDLMNDPELEPLEREEETKDGETTYRIKFQRTCKEGRLRVANVPPEELRISADAKTLFPGAARMVGQETEITRSDLVAMGFDKDVIYKLPSIGEQYSKSDEKISRYNKTDEQREGFADPSQELVEYQEAYIKLDVKGTGKSELHQVIIAGGELLSYEPIDRQPFHVLCAQPLPHKHFGRAPAEKVMDVQEISTTLTRQSLDNLYRTNMPGHGVSEMGIGENTLDDLLTTRIGQVVRFSRNPGESYMPMTVPFTAQASLGALEYFDKVKRDRTGVNADSEGLSPEQLKNIQTTVMSQANDLSRMKIETIVRVFAETGIKSLFLHIRELLMKHQKKSKVVELRNEWVEVSPSEWRTRYNTTINIGLGVGTKEANLMHLNDIWEKQAMMVQNGGLGVTVTPKNIYNTAAEMVKNANYKNADMFFTDPGDIDIPQGQEEDPQAVFNAQLLQLELAKLQQNAQQTEYRHQEKIAELTMKQREREDKLFVELEKLRNDLTEMELKYEKEVAGARNAGDVVEYDPNTGNFVPVQ